MRLFTPQPARCARNLILAAAVACLAVSAGAQDHGPGRPPGGGPPGGGPPGAKIGAKEGFGTHDAGSGGMGNATRLPSSAKQTTGGLQLGPPVRWWDNKEYARTIGINSIQQRRMDDLFTSNRDNLMRLDRSLQHEESQLKKLTRSQTLDENLIYQQIDRVTLARGELEKAYAHMLLQIRKEMTPDQTSKLDDLNAQQ
jgi:hypothetical protein